MGKRVIRRFGRSWKHTSNNADRQHLFVTSDGILESTLADLFDRRLGNSLPPF